jgi:hypothetical protein
VRPVLLPARTRRLRADGHTYGGADGRTDGRADGRADRGTLAGTHGRADARADGRPDTGPDGSAQQHGHEYCRCAHDAQVEAEIIKAAGTTISTLFVKPANVATNACPGNARCYPPENFLAERVASQGLDNTADWNNIDQQVGTLADQIVAKIC